MTIRVSDSAASAIEVEVVDGAEDGDGYDPIRAAWTGRSLRVTPRNAASLAASLTELSNACDDISQERAAGADENVFNRRASLSLTTLAAKCHRIART